MTSALKLARRVQFRRAVQRAQRCLAQPGGAPASRLESPVIVVGMHRSGTSMVATLLEGMDVCMGRSQLAVTNEAKAFLRINRVLFDLAAANWDRPEPLRARQDDQAWREGGARFVAAELLSSGTTRSYWGSRRNARWAEVTWGWKEPRTSITLPIWLMVFPRARVVHVRREALAVAQSLASRTARHVEQGRPRSELTLSVDYNRELRQTYLDSVDGALAGLPAKQCLTVQYEEVVRQPAHEIARLAAFCGVSPSNAVVAALASEVRPPA